MPKNLVSLTDISFILQAPREESLIKIYEHFIGISIPLPKHYYPEDLDELGKMPKKAWYKELTNLIEAHGIDEYREHVAYQIEKCLRLQLANIKFDKLREADRKNGNFHFETHYLDYEGYDPRDYHPMQEGPTHFYFYCSEKGPYLRGLIHSVSCVPDPSLLRLLEKFATQVPFVSRVISQGPTGLYTYDVLHVFSQLPYQKAVPHILNLKNRIKQNRAQKRFQKELEKIAKKQKIGLAELLELGDTDYGFDSTHVYRKEFENYYAQLSFPKSLQKELLWVNTSSNKAQKAIPKEVKENEPESLKYLKNHVKEVENQLITQNKRIERLYLKPHRWEMGQWLGKYGNHPLLGIICKRLLWVFEKDQERLLVYFDGREWKDQHSEKVTSNNYTHVRLWHPLDKVEADLEKLTELFAELGIVQPFKQPDRECYKSDFISQIKGSRMYKAVLAKLLPDRSWQSMSNPHIMVPHLNMAARLTVQDAVDGSAGKFEGSANLELLDISFGKDGNRLKSEEVPPIILSEILRDVDLFISVAKPQDS